MKRNTHATLWREKKYFDAKIKELTRNLELPWSFLSVTKETCFDTTHTWPFDAKNSMLMQNYKDDTEPRVTQEFLYNSINQSIKQTNNQPGWAWIFSLFGLFVYVFFGV